MNEVENLASQMTSPASMRSPYGSKTAPLSPRVSMTSVNRRSGELTQILNTSAPYNNKHMPRSSAGVQWSQASPTYVTAPESFERANVTSGPRKLAPAPDLVASGRAGVANGKSGAKPIPTYAQRAMTPTQQEQDAVDSLLLMGSPANSQPYYGSSNGSPRRPQFSGSPPRRMEGPISSAPLLVNGVNASSENEYLGTKRMSMNTLEMERQAKRRSLAGNVEQLLNQMAETSSDDDIIQIGTHQGHMAGMREGEMDVRG